MEVYDALRWEVNTSRSNITNFRSVGLENMLNAKVPRFRIRIFRVRRNVRRSQPFCVGLIQNRNSARGLRRKPTMSQERCLAIWISRRRTALSETDLGRA